MSRSAHVITVLLILSGLILFEALQQRYYLVTFELADASEITLTGLFQNHLLWWVVLVICAIPLLWYTRLVAMRPLNKYRLTYQILFFLGAIASSIVGVATISILRNGIEFSQVAFLEHLEFFMYQKGPLFSLALVCGTIYLHLVFRNSVLKYKIQSLAAAKEQDPRQYARLKNYYTDQTKIVTVKIGNRVKLIPLENIIWIESDNYCVRIHTLDKRSYTLRSTMKKMEQALPEFQFVRVHRTAIVNCNAIREVNIGRRPGMILSTGQRIDIAMTRMPDLKDYLRQLNISDASDL